MYREGAKRLVQDNPEVNKAVNEIFERIRQYAAEGLVVYVVEIPSSIRGAIISVLRQRGFTVVESFEEHVSIWWD
jgi:hypothetical protein